jgi:hypothetical protein
MFSEHMQQQDIFPSSPTYTIISNTPSREKNREIVILAEKRTQKFVILAAFCSK